MAFSLWLDKEGETYFSFSAGFETFVSNKIIRTFHHHKCKGSVLVIIQPIMLSSRIFGNDYKKTLKYAKENDFQGVEWYLNSSRVSTNPERNKKFFSALEQHPELTFTFHLPTTDVEIGHIDPKIAQGSRDYLISLITLIKPWLIKQEQPTVLTIHIGSNSLAEEYLDWENAKQNLKLLNEHATNANALLCLENLKSGWTTNPDLLLELAEHAGTQLTFDTGHARSNPLIINGDFSIEDYFAKLAPMVRHIHFYYYESLDKGEHLPPKSYADIADVLALIKQHPHIQSLVLELSTIEFLEQTRTIVCTGGG